MTSTADGQKSIEEKGRELFDELHHPESGMRQLADWYSGDPQNPPPLVKDAIQRYHDLHKRLMRAITPEMRGRLARRD